MMKKEQRQERPGTKFVWCDRLRFQEVLALTIAATLCSGCQQRRRDLGLPGETTVTGAESKTRSQPASSVLPERTEDVAKLAAKVSPTVVNITATQELRVPRGFVDPFEFFFGERGPHGRGRGGGGGSDDNVYRRRGLGSGFIIDDAGHVVTNAHVVENATAVRVTLSDERELDAKVKGRDARLDVAVLELDKAHDLPHATLGQSEPLRVGEYVVAIGNPFGLGNTVTMGIVSAKGRAIGAGPYDDFVQTDASINPGNSGGPLFNLRGEVIGINTAIVASAQGIGFATPIDAAKQIIPQLIEKGHVSRGRLGVAIQEVDSALAKALGLDSRHGALVTQLESGSPAEKAGLKAGDLIVRFEGTEIVHAHDLPRLVARHPPGTKVKLTVAATAKKSAAGSPRAKTEASPREITVTLDELPDERTPQQQQQEQSKPPPNTAKPGGSTPTIPSTDRGFGLELGEPLSGGGAVVRGVVPGSPASDALIPGDVILEVNGVRVSNAREASTRIRETPSDRPALVRIQREGRALFAALERQK